MEAAKIHLFATILMTQAAALWRGRVPYFPIEIFRTAAAGDVPLLVFKTGITLLLATLYSSKCLDWITFFLWTGVMVVAFVPDTTHLIVHNLGVLVVFITAGYYVYRHSTSAAFAPLACAVTIFLLRLVFKLLVLVVYDKYANAYLFNAGSAITAIKGIHARGTEFMFMGRAAYGTSPSEEDDAAWAVIAGVFKICGVLQWVAFYSLSLVF